MKTEWCTPKLICLYRGRPEEAVLELCKGAETAPQEMNAGPGFLGCYHQDGFCNCCQSQWDS